MEVGTKTGTTHGERSPERLTQGNGYGDTDRETGARRSNCVFPSCVST